MYYIRGALSAATSYYKDLPAINPSTLTGAIDVIVVQRPAPDGGTELACSPFHVRFGKWQVLRPSDRMVTVQLNGKPVPFSMKIGDAGEAFWVFETDDDVPEELMTSPVLEPTKNKPPQAHQTLKPGAFGATDDDDADEQQTSALGAQEQVALAQVEASRETTAGADADAEEEPDYLDLDAPAVKRRPPPLNSSSLSPSASEADAPQTPTKFSASSFLNHASDMGKAAVHDAKAQFRPPKLDSPAATAQETLELRGQDIRPPEVLHDHGVALDMSGYHARDVSDRTIVDHARRVSGSRSLGNGDELAAQLERERFAGVLRNREPQSDSDLSPGPSRPSSPEDFSRPGSYSTRATSEPPEGIDISQRPEYEWDWGAFPLKTPAIKEDGQFFFPESSPKSSSSPQLNAVDKEQDLATKSRRGLVQLGTLSSSPTGSFLLDMDSKKFEFELSLCGDEKTDDAFARRQVSYRQFLGDENVVQHPGLVIRWNSRYIARSDTSPLFAALVSWRDVALGLRRAATIEDEPLSSSDEREPLSVSAPAQTARTTSTWSRWWRGSRKQSSTETLLPTSRPTLKVTASEPTVAALSDIEPASPPRAPQSLPLSPAPAPQKRYVKTLRLTSDQLKELNLHDGLNTITFALSTTGVVACTARIFLWDSTDLVVVSDIDGTITKSDALGHVMTFMGRDWTHSGVAKLYTDICRNGYKMLYLTSRAIGQAGSTRHYLKGINQDSYQLPEGPVIMSPDRLFTSLHREVIMRRPEVFKMACLQDIRSLFGSANPFYAGFGNRITDAASYLKVDIPSARIFTIEYSGEVKMELLERAGFKSSYIHMTDLVDQMFPPVHRSVSPAFTDLNFWRAPISEEYPLPDLAPPSPALSARSGRSTLGRFNPASAISLLSSRSRSPVSGETSRATSPERGGSLPLHVQDVTKSLEELALERQRADDEYVALLRKRKSIDSMPGSLPSSLRMAYTEEPEEEDGEMDEEDEVDEYEDDPEAEAEDAFDEDLLATGEMENVPYL